MGITSNIPKIFLGLYVLLFVVLAIEPYDRAVWFVENLPVVIAVGILVVWYRKFQFSNMAYFWMWLFLCYHTIGGHWTFERVPFDYGNQLLSLLNMEFLLPEGRNNFDRLGHFLVGVFAYPTVEYLLRAKLVITKTVAFLFAVFALGFWAALYEVIEMYYAVLEGGEAGAAFLGSQGDIWDAQKDMWMDICGGVLFATLAVLKNYNK
jgi:putative membrane protein